MTKHANVVAGKTHKLVEAILDQVDKAQTFRRYGLVTAIKGALVEVGGIDDHVTMGSQVEIEKMGDGDPVRCEVVGFREGHVLLMPLDELQGIGTSSRAFISGEKNKVYPEQSWLGRVLNAFGDPVDGKGNLNQGSVGFSISNTPPPAGQRARVGPRISTGIRVMDLFTALCKGQRLGVFAGSGVGKSTVMSMMARSQDADVVVIGLVGERGRELQEFIEDDLGVEGLKKSVIVCATSDESALLRRQAAYTSMAVAEYFRDQGAHVLLMVDSITRFAMAQREIGLSAGEPPTSKGYPPTVFAELPRLLERAGPGVEGSGYITALFTVLVDGDDVNEPIADAVRGILDGHVVLDRAIAERGRYPALNVLKSVSRTMPSCNTAQEQIVITQARKYISLYDDMKEMIRLGAYKQGSDPDIDMSIRVHGDIEALLTQHKGDLTPVEESFVRLTHILQTASGEDEA